MRYVFILLLLASPAFAQTNRDAKTQTFRIGVNSLDDQVTDSRPLPVTVQTTTGDSAVNRISTTAFNSRAAATLAAGATFQGVGEEVTQYGRVGVSITSDNATDGVLTMEVSRDGVTWGGPTRTWSDTRFAQPHMWVIVERYFRIKYVNGTTEATNLAIQTHYSVDPYIQLGHQLDETLLDETEAIVTRSVLVGQDSGGNYLNVDANKGGALLTSEFGSEVALGNIPGYLINTKFGRNSDTDTGSGPEDLWEGGSEYTGQPIGSPETIEVFSSDNDDKAADTGAITMVIRGLKTDASTAYENETISLNGTTAVDSVSTWWRVNRAWVATAGSSGGNEGTITIRHKTTTANVFAAIPIGENQTMIGCDTVPADMTMLIKRIRIGITRSNGSAGSANVTLRMREPGSVFRAIRNFEIQTGDAVEFASIGGITCIAGCDLKFRIESVSDNNTIADGAFEYFLFDND